MIMNLDDTIFDRGKHKGKTWKYVRMNETEYIVFLFSKPAGSVVHYFPFIKYCMDFLQLDVTDE